MLKYKYVYEIYKEKSFSKAAKNLYVSQPALSAMIRRIEEELGQKIFDRSTSALTLTQCGEAYIETAGKMIELEDELYAYLDDLVNLKAGNLILAGTAFFSSYIIPKIVKEYKKLYPGIHLEFVEADSAELYQALPDNDWDLIVDAGSFDAARFEKSVLFEERILLAVSKSLIRNSKLEKAAYTEQEIKEGKHISDTKRSIKFSELGELSFVMLKKEHDLYRRAMDMCREQKYKPDAPIHLNQLATAYSLAVQGFGMTIVSDSIIKYANANNEMLYYEIEVQEKTLNRRDVFIACRKNKHKTSSMVKFIELAYDLYK